MQHPIIFGDAIAILPGQAKTSSRSRPTMPSPRLLSLAIPSITLLGWMSQWFWPSWAMDLASSFQVQYAIANLLLWLLLLSHSLKSPSPANTQNNKNNKSTKTAYAGLLLGLACLTFQVSLLGNWYRSDAAAVATAATAAAPSQAKIKLLSLNIYPGLEDYDSILSLIRQEQPDLVLLQEATALSLEQFGTLQNLLPHHLDKVPPGHRKPGEKYPPKGTAIFSRLPLTLQPADPDSPLDNAGISVLAQIPPGNAEPPAASTEFQIHNVHGRVPIRPSFYRQRNDQLAAVFSAANEVDLPAIAMGDFNTAIWSPRLSPRQTQRLQPARQSWGIVPTWRPNVAFPPGLQWLSHPFWIPIDHCYVTPEIAVGNFRTGPDVKSDHLPLIVALEIPRKNSPAEPARESVRERKTQASQN